MFLSGVIEGFYGRAWTLRQRVEMLDWIKAAGMNAFVYGPKDDIKIRARWRETYNAAEAAELQELVEAAASRGVQFMVAIAPCLEVEYSDATDLKALHNRLDQLLDLGIAHVALLFDDIPARMSERDTERFGSFAAAQCHFANTSLAHLRARAPEASMLFCPTEYCGAFAGHDVGNSTYLQEIGRKLDPEIGVFWTGPDIVSSSMPLEGLREVGRVLGRKPVIWENFHANDYDLRRVHAGPLGGRSAEMLELVSGFINNPNNEFEANFVPVMTTGAFVAGVDDEETALAVALSRWQGRFQLAFRPDTEVVPLAEIRLIVELCYQPFRCGPEIERLLAVARGLLAAHRPDISQPGWQQGYAELRDLRDRIRTLFNRLTELENRDLFYTFHPYLWEAREEVTHLVSYLDWLAESPVAGAAFPQEERIYNFYRQGFGVAMQELLPRDRKGRFGHGA